MSTVAVHIRGIDEAIGSNIDALGDHRGLLSQNMLLQLRNLVEGVAVSLNTNDQNAEYNNAAITAGLAHTKAHGQLAFLNRFCALFQPRNWLVRSHWRGAMGWQVSAVLTYPLLSDLKNPSRTHRLFVRCGRSGGSSVSREMAGSTACGNQLNCVCSSARQPVWSGMLEVLPGSRPLSFRYLSARSMV
ncbi:hypothetical protein [Cryobacterium psychrophilum]|uniref:Uncharacterized protein n=1 Tax=Cryobacterium psychrophilum TaxID=41988 RepID=A0A4Y8KL95_9MICO|nr:hypothetical protein [Cryobacterium psychrophilum]TDW28924.1 hypothetical protein EDD25_0594 [Cryobacterium psychrophilum]TFD76875.1 hypothetical protein E3T53_12695 [Cryobacterium psychrophilum]